jgi:hypothetical protein
MLLEMMVHNATLAADLTADLKRIVDRARTQLLGGLEQARAIIGEDNRRADCAIALTAERIAATAAFQRPITQPPACRCGPRHGRNGMLLTRVRAAPESVKRRLRPVLVWLVRAALAVPGSKWVARAVMRRSYETYRQMSLGAYRAKRSRSTVAGAHDLSPDEALHLRWIETALRSRHGR